LTISGEGSEDEAALESAGAVEEVGAAVGAGALLLEGAVSEAGDGWLEDALFVGGAGVCAMQGATNMSINEIKAAERWGISGLRKAKSDRTTPLLVTLLDLSDPMGGCSQGLSLLRQHCLLRECRMLYWSKKYVYTRLPRDAASRSALTAAGKLFVRH
jgi:hypothetical protein